MQNVLKRIDSGLRTAGMTDRETDFMDRHYLINMIAYYFLQQLFNPPFNKGGQGGFGKGLIIKSPLIPLSQRGRLRCYDILNFSALKCVTELTNKSTKVWKNKFSHTIRIILNIFLGLGGVIALLVITPGLKRTAYAFQGPLYIRNSHPMFVGTGSPVLESAQIRESFDVDLTYSSTYLVRNSGEWSFNIDLEALITDLRLNKVVGNRLELGLDLPLIDYYGGILDGMLKSYHDTFGFSDYGRGLRPDNEFLFQVNHNGLTVVEGKSGGVSLGDIKISAREVLSANDPVISMNAFLELPTGDADKGYGSGGYEWGMTLLMDKTLGRSLMAYTNLGIVFADKYRGRGGIDLRNYLFGGLGIEWMYTRNLSLYTQFFIQDTPFEKTGIREMDEPGSILSFGAKYLVSRDFALELSFSEDPNTAGAPDFMVSLGSSYKY